MKDINRQKLVLVEKKKQGKGGRTVRNELSDRFALVFQCVPVLIGNVDEDGIHI